MDVNVIGLLLCYRVAVAAMIKCGTAKGGRLIGACSVAGKRGTFVEQNLFILFIIDSFNQEYHFMEHIVPRNMPSRH